MIPMDEIVSTAYLSAALRNLAEIYDTSSWRRDIAALQDMGYLYYRLSRVNPNDWYLTDEEAGLVRNVGRLLTENGVIG
jgi:hypothetical protein